MRVCHTLDPVFDDPNLIAFGGLPAVLTLAEQAGLHDLVDEHVTVPGTAGANASVKVTAIIAGMIAGADSISDLDVLRHGGTGRVFTGLRAATTLGTHLRGYRFGHVRQLDAVAARLLGNLARVSPILTGADQLVYVDVDDTVRETHGYRKQGAAYGYSRVKGLNAQVAIVSTPLAAPVIAATRLRKGNIDSGHGAARLIGDSLATLRRATRPGLVVVRADSAYFRHDVVAAATAGGARFSVTARMNKAVVRAIAGIDEQAWTTIRYRDAIYDEVEQRWISEAEVAEVPFTAFTSHRQ
ncbi:MAG TPA: transposase, partial [Micropruina sp.]|nr:transposase [Micropruina sp.]